MNNEETHTYYNSVFHNGRYWKFSCTKSAFAASLAIEDENYVPEDHAFWTDEDTETYNEMLISEEKLDKE